MFSFVNDTVLDPFLGSGTTSLAAKNLERNSMGYEINPNYISVIKERLGLKDKGFFDKFSFELAQNREDDIDWKEEIKKLPYIFKDPVKFDKKIDPRTISFGSKINNNNKKIEEYYYVKEVVSPERLVIGDGLQVRLLGIKEKPEMSGQAIEYLRDKTRGQKVFLKFDIIKYNKDNCLLCYLYLINKTFVNTHLIRTGFVDVDTSLDYKLKTKFLEIKDKNCAKRVDIKPSKHALGIDT